MSHQLLTIIRESLLLQVFLAVTFLLAVFSVVARFVPWKPAREYLAQALPLSPEDPEAAQKNDERVEKFELAVKKVISTLIPLTNAFAFATLVLFVIQQSSAPKCACLSGNVKKFIAVALASRSSAATESGFKPEYYSFDGNNLGHMEPFELKEEDPFKSRYEQGKELGRGVFGVVFEAVDKENKKVAIKMITSYVSPGPSGNPPAIRGIVETTFQEEVKAMKRFSELNGDRFVKFTDAFKDANHFYIVMEHLEGRALNTLTFKDANAVSVIAREILEAVKFLHEHDWRHRDIKPDNIFLTTDGQVKLLDFGISCPIGEGDANGTPQFSPQEMFPMRRMSKNVALFDQTIEGAPELLEQERNAVLRFFRQFETIDIFGMGATIKALCPKCEDADLKEFLDLTMDVRPWNRPTAASLLRHPFITVYQHVKVSGLQLMLL